MNGNNPFDDGSDYLFKMVTPNGRRKTYGWSLASMISGILSVICCCTGYAGIVFGVLAIIFAVISRRNLGYFDGMSVAGLVLGIIGFVLGIAVIVATYTLDDEFFEEYNKYLEDYLKEMEDAGGSDAPDL